jgi:GNAT superfamily N-acetyltransferase
MPPAAEYFIGAVGGELVCHLAVAPFFQNDGYRGTRLVVMPEWQGAGVGTKFLEWICEYHKNGFGRCGKKLPTLFHTSHPQLIGYLRHSKKWVLKSQQMAGAKSRKMTTAGAKLRGDNQKKMVRFMGGHFRAVQGFKYIGVKI